MLELFGVLQDQGLTVHLLCHKAECEAGLLEAVDECQDWHTFLDGLPGSSAGNFCVASLYHSPCRVMRQACICLDISHCIRHTWLGKVGLHTQRGKRS